MKFCTDCEIKIFPGLLIIEQNTDMFYCVTGNRLICGSSKLKTKNSLSLCPFKINKILISEIIHILLGIFCILNKYELKLNKYQLKYNQLFFFFFLRHFQHFDISKSFDMDTKCLFLFIFYFYFYYLFIFSVEPYGNCSSCLQSQAL